MNDSFILAIDQGTTGNTVMLFDRAGRPCGKAYAEFPQIFPQPGWVEHDALIIWQECERLIASLLRDQAITGEQIAGIGVTNQRETIVVWDARTGKPVANAIVWQDRRTAAYCSQLKADGLEPMVQEKTGLLLDPYFSATKLKWILDQDTSLRTRAESGQLIAGTMDSWLVWQLSGGKHHVSDCSNASRTMLYNIHQLRWDPELLRLFDIPEIMLPEVVSSSAAGRFTCIDLFAHPVPISGIAGDQQAALFGQACYGPGKAKNTYGTGSFMLMNTGTTAVASKERLLTTIAWQLGDEPVEYALEGSVFISGAAVQWLRDGLGIIEDAAETQALAESLSSNDGVYFVPALAGLGAPWWDPLARGLIIGLTRGTTKAHIVRATLEAICYQTRDVVAAMSKESGIELKELRADGGAVANKFLMQFQADILNVEVRIPAVTETTALGAAYLAGLAVGFWESREQIDRIWTAANTYSPTMAKDQRDALYAQWVEAVGRSRGWAGARD